MNGIYRNFFRGLYANTGGYICSKPINLSMYPGDFFQIRNGEVIILGNIFRNGIVDSESTSIECEVKLNPLGWSFLEGVSKPYSGRGAGDNPIEGEFEFSKQILAFKNPGDYVFKGIEPKAMKIMNWSSIWQQLIIKLTQTLYSFREVYVITESVSLEHWTLAIAGAKDAELEIATNSENFGLVDIFGNANSRTLQSKDIEYYHRQEVRKPSFFKAKRLVVQNDKLEIFVSNLVSDMASKHDWAQSFFDCEINASNNNFVPRLSYSAKIGLLDMLQANELNPNTALQYFKWEDTNLDDVEKLFMVYGS